VPRDQPVDRHACMHKDEGVQGWMKCVSGLKDGIGGERECDGPCKVGTTLT